VSDEASLLADIDRQLHGVVATFGEPVAGVLGPLAASGSRHRARMVLELSRHGDRMSAVRGAVAVELLHLGSLYQRHLHTADIVPEALRAVVAELKEGASFYVRDGDRRLCLHRVDALRSVRDSVHEGDRLPLNVGAAGHVIRAFSGSSGSHYEKVRGQMYAASFGERDPEVAAVACPVFGLNQKLLGALAVSGPLYRIEAIGVEPMLRVLLKHAARLTSGFGGDPAALAAALVAIDPKTKPKRIARVR